MQSALSPYQQAMEYQRKLDEKSRTSQPLPTVNDFIKMAGVDFDDPESIEHTKGLCREYLYVYEGITASQRKLLNETLRILEST